VIGESGPCSSSVEGVRGRQGLAVSDTGCDNIFGDH
jgi:hypothetical protein